ncbi:MAG: FeoB small GTPase domain-containing protein [Anaerotignum sp.]
MGEEKRPCIALAGNPNTGKSTLFNALTGLKQHTGNWSGKTVGRAEGRFLLGEKEAVLVDLPGIYSLFAGVQRPARGIFWLLAMPTLWQWWWTLLRWNVICLWLCRSWN